MRKMTVLAIPKKDRVTGNPYVSLLYKYVETNGVKVDDFSPIKLLLQHFNIVHFHWPQEIFTKSSATKNIVLGLSLAVLISIHKVRGAKVLWTVHNVLPHERNWTGRRYFTWFFLPFVDGLIYLTESAREQAVKQFPRLALKRYWTIPHGHYRPTINEDIFRTKPRINPPRIGMFGAICPYKNVEHLITSFKQLSENLDLHIGGKPLNDDMRDAIEAAAAGDRRIQLTLRHLDQQEMYNMIADCCLIVLPFRDILHSGSAILALSLNRPILVPNRGAMAELQDVAGTNWVTLYDGLLTPTVLKRAVRSALSLEHPAELRLDKMDFSEIAMQTVEAYRGI